MPDLPPLNSLRAFEAAARHLSFTKAAQELHVTPAAVSQQIRQLEAFYGIPLFRRTTRTLILTEAAQMALPDVKEGFDRLMEANRRLRSDRHGNLLTVSSSPSMGERWLLPRLERFRAQYPDIDIRIDTTDRLADFVNDRVDIAIRYGRGNYDGLESDILMQDVAYPVCSPTLLDGDKPLKEPNDLRHHTLLHPEWRQERDAQPSWQMWLRAAGVTGIDVTRGLRFSSDTMLAHAAADGLGVALALSSMVQRELADGKLVRPFGDGGSQIETVFRPYLVYPKRNLALTRVAAFRDWAMKEAATPRL
ncbi:transcriptional regulator GcvA [Hwanghaeella grinnelliae]|uniref:Transcriptional regulator GcvA n=1 Tax=Hwanghaeella grinnelliae TaxID=2500179 RepID=A0A3S2WU34_9PROT|nr:transcriptional regulator GcvA [Hwanghaeella grinnelliae]RVU38502.1 transcriptional regulator GcvA [Hwanghaeella grinnelliae]